MYQDQTIRCRECGGEFLFSADGQAACAAPIRCAACREKRTKEDEALYEAAKADLSRAFPYRCSRCRRRVWLLRRWKRAIGLLYCPECKPMLYKNMPYDAALNREQQ